MAVINKLPGHTHIVPDRSMLDELKERIDKLEASRYQSEYLICKFGK